MLVLTVSCWILSFAGRLWCDAVNSSDPGEESTTPAVVANATVEETPVSISTLPPFVVAIERIRSTVAQGTTPKWKDILQAAWHNDTVAVKYFLREDNTLVRLCEEDEKTIAHIAVENGNLPLLEYIFRRFGSIALHYHDHAGSTILQRAIEKGDIAVVKYLVDVCEWNVSKPNAMSHGETPIHVAAAEGQLDILKYFIEEKEGDPNVKNNVGDPPAFLAADKSHLNVVKYLDEERKANMTVLDNHQCNILYSSARCGDLIVPKYLLDEKRLPLDVNWRDITSCTIVHTATRHAKYEFVRYMVHEHRADLNIADEMGRTPLHEAAYQNNYPMCKFLVDNGARLWARDAYNNTPIEEATQPQLIGFLDQFWKERVTK